MGILRCKAPGSRVDLEWGTHTGGSHGAAWYHVVCLPHCSMLMSRFWGTCVLDIKLHSLIQAPNSEGVWRLIRQSILSRSLSEGLQGGSGSVKPEAGCPDRKASVPVGALRCLQRVSSIYSDVTVMRFSSSPSGRNSLFLTGGSLPPSSYVNTWKHKKWLWNVENFYSLFYVCSALKYNEIVLV